MENSRAAIITVQFIIAATIFSPVEAGAYSRNTHKGISEAVVKAFESRFGDKLSNAEKVAIVEGSWDEDDDWRFMRHFYDPVNNEGLFGQYESSKYWAQNTEAQANYECVGAWICYGEKVAYTEKYFSSPTDFSWDRAIYEYAWGDKVRAAESLGHIIHLIEDATVPAHVRNDAHPSAYGINVQADPYEKYAERYGQGDVLIPVDIVTARYAGIGDVFNEVALFTNENFVSSDTLFSDFKNPSLTEVEFDGQYLVSKSKHKIARAKGWVSFSGKVNITEVYIDDPQNSVAADYWRVLSKKAIEAGVGVIDLFFREVEKEKKTGALKAKNVSAAEVRAKENAKKYFGVVKGLYGSSLSQSDVEELLGETSGQTGAAVLAVGTNSALESVSAKSPVSTLVQSPPRNDEAVEPLVREQLEPVGTTEVVTPVENKVASSTATTTPSLQQLVPVQPGFGGGGPSVATVSETSTPTPVVPVALSVLSPFNGEFFATTSVSFSGTTEADGRVSISSGSFSASTTADSLGNWFATMDVAEGNLQIDITATDASGDRAASDSVDIWIDVTPPGLSTVSIPSCSNSLSAHFCLLATQSTEVVWSDVSDASYYALVVNGFLNATTTATSTTMNLIFSASTTVAVVSYDIAGNAATSTSELVYSLERPVVIHEIAWPGTDSNADDEWIELKNASSFELEMTKVVLSIDGTEYALTDTLDASALYLIEDRAESTSKQHSATLDIDLPDAGAKITLADTAGTVLDSTPEVATCAGWCGGSSSEIIGTSAQFGNMLGKTSMERVSSNSDGLQSSSWRSNDTYIRLSGNKATDSSGEIVYGTPTLENSSGIPNGGWSCGGEILSATGGSYNPTSSSCTYYSAFISTQANRYGDVYKGTVGSSTLKSGHSIAKSIQSDQNDAGISTGAASGDQFFVAIFEIRNGPAFNSDLTDFRNYFKTGVGVTPHSNYVTIPWTYSP